MAIIEKNDLNVLKTHKLNKYKKKSQKLSRTHHFIKKTSKTHQNDYVCLKLYDKYVCIHDK